MQSGQALGLAPVGPPADAPSLRAVHRVLASAKFRQAPRLSAFLLYVSEKALAGKPEEATEQQVGIHVFGRPPGYNPAEDNIVRSTARQLRERLALYYQEDGQDDDLRVVLVRGSYLPRFELVTPAVPVETAGPAVENHPARRNWLGGLARAGIAGAGLAALGIGAFLRRPGHNPLWELLLESSRPLILVPGDSGTVIRQNLTGQPVHVAEYANGAFRQVTPARVDDALLQDLGGRRYTSFSDLKFAARLAMTPGLQPDRFSIRYARDLHVDDLKGSNLVLVGAPQGNPWVELFHRDLNFEIVSDEPGRTLTVLNRRPASVEPTRYTYAVSDTHRRAYAILALTQNLDRTGHVLLVQGTSVAGIEAGTDFLFNEPSIGPILREASRNGALQPFEVLLETGHIAASGIGTVVRAKRFTT